VIWLVWRQHRRQLLAALIGLAALALVLIPTGLSSHKANAAYATCLDKLGKADFIAIEKVENCEKLSTTFNDRYESWAYAGILLLVLPLLAGLFWGAPLVAREVEQGTHRLVWTQGISRRKWAVTKFGLIGLVVVVLSVVYSVLITWWMEPLNNAVAVRLEYIFFDQQGVVPVAYTLFAVTVGIFAGTVVPRMLPAMATTLVVFLAVRISVAVFVRPNLQGEETKTALVSGGERIIPNPAAGSWITSAGAHAADGSVVQGNGIGYCVPSPNDKGGGEGPCGDFGVGAYNQWTYQPGDRFWLLQWLELGIFAVLSVALLYAALHRVRRSLA
jgi:ABC-type transport system involved in multi-copper enzyme maturation permease subunit